MTLTAQEIQQTQGTRLSTTAPWDSYDNEMGIKLTPELSAAVDAYAQKHYTNKKPSSETQEVLAEQKELNAELAQQYQWLKPEEYADYEARIGKVITHAELIIRLRKIGLICHYKQHMHFDKAVLWISKDVTSEAVKGPWVQIGQMPELSMMHFDEHGVPLAERRRGWRTVLLQLILGDFISEDKVIKEFGNPRQDKAFDKYNSLLKALRDSKLGFTE
jgi:hypothetical protein